MAVVATSSYRRSRAVSLQLARAVAARPDLFGYVPDMIRFPSSTHLSLADVKRDHHVLEVQHGLWGSGPVPTHGDGRIAMCGDKVQGAAIQAIEAPTAATPEGRVWLRGGTSVPASQAGLSWSA